MSIDAISLFSGGLDSILAAKALEAQGLNVLCLHFVSPFFGNPEEIGRWSDLYSLKIRAIDIGRQFCNMLCNWPANGFGKVLNPCVDCKILLLSQAKKQMESMGAKFIATGEVLGQRPMSQRRDTLFLISRDAGVRDILLRPLSALHLPPTPMEENGLVKRELLLGISGRGRQEQLELAQKFGLRQIPTPAGGCKLTEKENGRRYWPILKEYLCREKACANNDNSENNAHADFELASHGRQLWQNGHWLCIGRNSVDNEALRGQGRTGDIFLKLYDFSGPLGLARNGATWQPEVMASAAAKLASYSSKAIASGGLVRISLKNGNNYKIIEVMPESQGWDVPGWEETRAEIKDQAHERSQHSA